MKEFKILEDIVNFSFSDRRYPDVEKFVNSYLNDGWSIVSVNCVQNYIPDNCIRIIITLQRTINEKA